MALHEEIKIEKNMKVEENCIKTRMKSCDVHKVIRRRKKKDIATKRTKVAGRVEVAEEGKQEEHSAEEVKVSNYGVCTHRKCGNIWWFAS